MPVAGPAGGWVTVNDAMFLSYSVPPIRSCGEGCANSGDGGYEIRFRGADFTDSSDVRVYFTTSGLKDNIVFDADGTLCDVDSLNILHSLSGVPAWIVPFRSSNSLSPDVSQLLSLDDAYDSVNIQIDMPDPINCVIDTGTTGGIVCDGTKVILRTLALSSVVLRAGQHGIEDEPSAGVAKIHGTNVIGEGHAWVSAAQRATTRWVDRMSGASFSMSRARRNLQHYDACHFRFFR